jgi:Family of unknown function (DUF5677)
VEPEVDQVAAARECAQALLDASRVYENVRIPPGAPPEFPVIVALVARQRSHLKAVIALADAGLNIEAEIIDRTMFEFMIRLKWLLLDLELHLVLWKLNDIDYRFTLDREVREWADANQREMAVLRPDFREELERFRGDLTRRLAEITVERGLEREPTYPHLKAQAEAVGQTVEYALAYRLDSQSAAHPSVLALQNLVRQLPDGTIEVFAEPESENRLNVYGTGSVSSI